MIHIRSQVKTDKFKVINFKKNAKNSNFGILQKTLHVTHLLKLLDKMKMYDYEMEPTRTVGATQRTRDAGRMDGQIDRRTDGVKLIYPLTTSLCEEYNNNFVVRGGGLLKFNREQFCSE